jgi:hypothetical protein
MAFGIDDALMIGSVLLSLFGKSGNKQQQTTTTEQANPNWQSPLLGLMDPMIASMLLGNAQSLGGAGMPGGVSRFGGTSGTMMNDIMSLLQNEWPTIMGKYGDNSTCQQKCKKQYANDRTLYSECIKACNQGKTGIENPAIRD